MRSGSVNCVQEASVHLRAVADGAEFTITDRGRPVARLIPISRSRPPVAADLRSRAAGARTPDALCVHATTPGGPGLSELVGADREERRVLGA